MMRIRIPLVFRHEGRDLLGRQSPELLVRRVSKEVSQDQKVSKDQRVLVDRQRGSVRFERWRLWRLHADHLVALGDALRDFAQIPRIAELILEAGAALFACFAVRERCRALLLV